jgi:glycosidase
MPTSPARETCLRSGWRRPLSEYGTAAIVVLLLSLTECTVVPPAQDTDATSVPAWAEEAVWYQIFVERFANGDPSNDPTLEDIAGSWQDDHPDDWKVTSWTHDWYEQEDWAKATGRDFYYTVQMRRYGGDLAGVLNHLDYLQDLGITAIYFNPIYDAPSLHKYDARSYHHIDRNFGPDPMGDRALSATEDPADPSTWVWTAADSLFLQLLGEIHARGMRAIMDVSWNHTGVTFWAWRDVLENQARSRFASWYDVEQFDDPETSTNEFTYDGWAGVGTLPAFRKVGVPDDFSGGPVDGDLVDGVKAHVFAVTRRWMDPDGDGDPADGVDGFRLDVADQVPLGFWRDYRMLVKSINPDAYLVGEVWWEDWPDRMMDPRPYLGDVFDAVMNYQWYMPTRSFFASALPSRNVTGYVAHLDSVESGIPLLNLRAMMNVAASHDSPRLSTSLHNPGKYKFGVNPRDNPGYRVSRPGERTHLVQKMLLMQQFTYHGAPHIWYGDEVGMWGADDPDCRKPMLWSGLNYEPEDQGPDGSLRPPDEVVPDTALHRYYRDLIQLRRSKNRLLVEGDIDYTIVDDDGGILSYRRTLPGDSLTIVFNISGETREFELARASTFVPELSSRRGAFSVVSSHRASLLPRSGVVLVSR